MTKITPKPKKNDRKKPLKLNYDQNNPKHVR